MWGIHDYAQHLTPMGMPSHWLPPPSGCGFYRIVLPFEQLREHGWKVRYQAKTPPPEVAEYQIICGERLDRPEVLGAWRRFRATHRLAYELDDDIWNVEQTNVNAHRMYSRPAIQDAVETCITVSDVVIASTGPLAETIRRRTSHPNVVVCPNYIPRSNLDIIRPLNQRVIVGWTGGVSHTWDIGEIAAPITEVMDRTRHWMLHIQGTDFRPSFGNHRAPRMRYTDWVTSPRDYYKLLDFDIGLAPLASRVFNESKSWLKPLEYASLGIPVIASDTTAYRDMVRDGETGFLVKTRKQWKDRLELLIHDGALRESMGAKARALAAHYTIEEHWPKWAAAFEGIMR